MAAIAAGRRSPGPSDTEPPLRLLPARSAVAVTLSKDQQIRIINTHGTQVVDTWAFESANLKTHMSMEHIRASLQKLSIAVGDTLVSNHRTPILTVVADTTPGVHDTLIAACDKYRYAQLGATSYHPSCVDNLHDALQRSGLAIDSVPCPLNLFMNVPVATDGTLQFASPFSEAGQSVTLRAETNLILVMSACPQDMTPVNGVSCTDVHFLVT